MFRPARSLLPANETGHSPCCRKVRVTLRSSPVFALDHDFRFQPRLVAIVVRVQPVVDEMNSPLRFRFIPQAIFRFRPGA